MNTYNVAFFFTDLNDFCKIYEQKFVFIVFSYSLHSDFFDSILYSLKKKKNIFLIYCNSKLSTLTKLINFHSRIAEEIRVSRG